MPNCLLGNVFYSPVKNTANNSAFSEWKLLLCIVKILRVYTIKHFLDYLSEKHNAYMKCFLFSLREHIWVKSQNNSVLHFLKIYPNYKMKYWHYTLKYIVCGSSVYHIHLGSSLYMKSWFGHFHFVYLILTNCIQISAETCYMPSLKW